MPSGNGIQWNSMELLQFDGYYEGLMPSANGTSWNSHGISRVVVDRSIGSIFS